LPVGGCDYQEEECNAAKNFHACTHWMILT
jgi:hypothetical protein